MSDIVERLLRFRPVYGWPEETSTVVEKSLNQLAVDEITRLRDENENLRGLLREAHVKMDENKLWVNLRRRIANTLFDE